MIYFGEGLGEIWLRDNSAYHEAQRNDPLCGTKVVVTDQEHSEYGRVGFITKVAEFSPTYKITLKKDRYGEEFIYLDKWQFKIIEE